MPFIPTKPYIGKRLLAGFIDYLIITLFFMIYVFLVGKLDGEGGYSVTGAPALIPVFFWFFMTVIMEQLLGATLGNWAVKLKPVTMNTGQKISFSQSCKRHFADIIDLQLFGLVAYLTIKSSPKSQRVGDLWAKTIVVAEDMEVK